MRYKRSSAPVSAQAKLHDAPAALEFIIGTATTGVKETQMWALTGETREPSRRATHRRLTCRTRPTRLRKLRVRASPTRCGGPEAALTNELYPGPSHLPMPFCPRFGFEASHHKVQEDHPA